MPTSKYRKHITKDTDKKYKIAIVWYAYFLAFIILVQIENKILSVIKNLTLVVLTSLLIGDTAYYQGKQNKYTLRLHLVFSEMLKYVEKYMPKQKEKINLKVELYRTSYVFIFFLIPILFLIWMANGHWQDSMGAYSSNGEIGALQGVHKEVNSGIIQILPSMKTDTRVKFSYMLGNVLDMPVLDVCFINNGTTHPTDTLNDSFKSNVMINNQTYSIPFKGEYCVAISTDKQNMEYMWTTEYLYVFKNREIINNVQDVSSQAKNIREVRINNNFYLMTSLVIIAWLGACHLVYSVFKDLGDIK